MKRGDIVTVALRGDYGKPRPAVIVQSDRLQGTDSIIICPLTSDLQPAPLFRVDVEPTEANGLRSTSQIMVDKISGVPRAKLGTPIGRLEPDRMERLTEALIVAIGVADQA